MILLQGIEEEEQSDKRIEAMLWFYCKVLDLSTTFGLIGSWSGAYIILGSATSVASFWGVVLAGLYQVVFERWLVELDASEYIGGYCCWHVTLDFFFFSLTIFK